MDLSSFEKHHIALKSPLLIIKGPKGLLGCGYLNVEAFNRGSEAAAIVTGVRTHDDMLRAKVIAASEAARALGVEIGMPGDEALKKFA
jgi:uncharacterized protein YunC (DUF1805 family)